MRTIKKTILFTLLICASLMLSAADSVPDNFLCTGRGTFYLPKEQTEHYLRTNSYGGYFEKVATNLVKFKDTKVDLQKLFEEDGDLRSIAVDIKTTPRKEEKYDDDALTMENFPIDRFKVIFYKKTETLTSDKISDILDETTCD